MIKNTVIALVAAASLAGIAAPAFADTGVPQSIVAESAFDNATVIARLKDKGVTASAVEEWGDMVRAYVTLEDGAKTMRFFTNDTLTPVSL